MRARACVHVNLRRRPRFRAPHRHDVAPALNAAVAGGLAAGMKLA
jgi:hypothetical protein